MQISVHHLEWRVLRQVARTKKPSLGSTLRLEMNRRTKDGSFLTKLVKQGLLSVSPKGTPFESTYALTELGKHAAEYGVYDVSWEQYKEQSHAARG